MGLFFFINADEASCRISSRLQSQLNDADWATKREIVGALVRRIEIGAGKATIVLRLPMQVSARALEPIMVTLSQV